MTLLRKCLFLSCLFYATKITKEKNAMVHETNLKILFFMEDQKKRKYTYNQ